MFILKDCYVPGKFRQKFFGQKVERDKNDGLDSAGKGILFQSESITKVAYKNPEK